MGLVCVIQRGDREERQAAAGNERKARHSTGEREGTRGIPLGAHTTRGQGGMFHWATSSNDVKGDAGHTGTRAMSLCRGPRDMARSISPRPAILQV